MSINPDVYTNFSNIIQYFQNTNLKKLTKVTDSKVEKCFFFGGGGGMRIYFWTGGLLAREWYNIHVQTDGWNHRLNIELDIQSLFGLPVHSYVLIGWDPATLPLPPHLGSYTRALLVSQERERETTSICGPLDGT